MTPKEVLEELSINFDGQPGRGNSYVIDLPDDIEFGKVYSILESNEEVDQLEDNNLLTVHNASLLYSYKDIYQINIKADFDNDVYSVVCTDISNDGN